MNNDATWWKNALAGNVAPIDTNTPAYGFYRTRNGRDRPLVPVALWYDDGQLECLFNNQAIDEHKAKERWPYISKRPITYDAYQKRIETGRWDDCDEVVANQA